MKRILIEFKGNAIGFIIPPLTKDEYKKQTEVVKEALEKKQCVITALSSMNLKELSQNFTYLS